MNKKNCHELGCNNRNFSAWLYNGKHFCKNHYAEVFLNELQSRFNKWDGVTEPTDRLKYLVGRYYKENERALLGKPSLTKAIVHERSYGWRKTEEGAIFTTIRYPINRELGEPYCDEVHHTWEFSLKRLAFKFLSEEERKYFGIA